MLLASALMLAWAIDSLFGRVAAPLGRRVRDLPVPAAFAAGATLWLVLLGSTTALARGVEAILRDAPAWLVMPLLALALKPAFAWRMLRDEVRGVEVALDEELEAGRQRIARLRSRDATQLDVHGVRETAIETLAENSNDSLVAPLFWFIVAGLPGARGLAGPPTRWTRYGDAADLGNGPASGPGADLATHRAPEAVFDHRVVVHELGGQWVALPRIRGTD